MKQAISLGGEGGGEGGPSWHLPALQAVQVRMGLINIAADCTCK